MKRLILFLCLFLPLLLAAQTCDYDQLFREGKSFARQRQYKKALYKFNSARRCDPAKGERVDDAIEDLLDQVEKERKTADAERKEADKQRKIADKEKQRAEAAFVRADSALVEVSQQKQKAELQQKLAQQAFLQTDSALAEVKKQQEKNRRIIESIDFYADRFALVVKSGKYGFIDKEGNVTIDYKYDEATPFDRTGYAQVKIIVRNKHNKDSLHLEYMLDTFDHTLPLARYEYQLDTSITAMDLSSKKLKKMPSIVFANKQLKVLILSNNSLSALPDEIENLRNLQKIDLSDNLLATLPVEIQNLKSLRWLVLDNNQISSQEIRTLRNTMPWCKIEDNHYSAPSKIKRKGRI